MSARIDFSDAFKDSPPVDFGDVEGFAPKSLRSRTAPGAEKLKGIRDELLTHWDKLYDELERAGVRPIIKSGFRTAEQQNYLHTHGYPTMGNDGYNKISPHQEGRGLDIGFAPGHILKGRQILADYARRNGLSIPGIVNSSSAKKEPWHISLPKSSAGNESSPFSDVRRYPTRKEAEAEEQAVVDNFGKPQGVDFSDAERLPTFNPPPQSEQAPLGSLVSPILERPRTVNDEAQFRQWYARIAKQNNLNPDPDAPEHHYDYRAAFRAGASPDASGHWPSEFKDKSHPNRFVEQDGQVIDSITSNPANELTRPRVVNTAAPDIQHVKGLRQQLRRAIRRRNNLRNQLRQQTDLDAIESQGQTPEEITSIGQLKASQDQPVVSQGELQRREGRTGASRTVGLAELKRADEEVARLRDAIAPLRQSDEESIGAEGRLREQVRGEIAAQRERERSMREGQGGRPAPTPEQERAIVEEQTSFQVSNLLKDQSAEEELARRERVSKLGFTDRARNAVNAALQTFADLPASALDTQAFIQSLPLRGALAVGRKLGITDRDTTIEDAPTAKIAESIRGWVRNYAPANPDLAEDFLASQLPQGLASAISFMGPGIVTKSATLVPALLGISSGMSSGYHDAKQHGATENQALVSALLNGGIGASEAIPIGKWIERINKASGGTASKILKEMAVESAEEFIQELGQQVAGNTVAKHIYDEKREYFEGAWQNASVGGVVGALLGGGTGVAGHALSKVGHAETQAVQESPPTIEAQTESAANPESPRTAVFYPKGTSAPEHPKGFYRIVINNGILDVDKAKAKEQGLSKPRDVREFVAENGIEPLIGKVAPVVDTSRGAALRTEDAEGNELSTSVITSPETAEVQAEVDQAQFPQAARQEILPAQEAAIQRRVEAAAQRLNISPEEYRNGVAGNLSTFDNLKPNERVYVNGVRGYVIDRPSTDAIRVNVEGEEMYGVGGTGETVVTRKQASDPFERGVQLQKVYEPSIDVEAKEVIGTPRIDFSDAVRSSDEADAGRVKGTDIDRSVDETAVPAPVTESAETAPAESRSNGQKVQETPRQWRHADFGLVTESSNQSGAGKGHVRVVDGQGAEHVIQQSNGRGQGNTLAVPVRRGLQISPREQGSTAQINVPESLEQKPEPAQVKVGKSFEQEGESAQIESVRPIERGALYHVELAPEESDYLLWDKPLSEQSEKVKSALKDYQPSYELSDEGDGWYSIRETVHGNTEPTEQFTDKAKATERLADLKRSAGSQVRGNQIYGLTSRQQGSDKAASDYLHPLGIRGIKYLDQGSRSSGEGSYNYVIFSDEDVSIKEVLKMARLNHLRDVENAADLIPQITQGRDGNLLTVNAEGQEFLRRAFEQNAINRGEVEGPEESSFDGVFLDPKQTRETVKTLRGAARQMQESGYTEQEVRSVSDLAQNLIDAARAGKGTAVIKFTDAPDSAIPHEFFHEGSFKGAEGKVLEDRHARIDELENHEAVKAWREFYADNPEYASASRGVAVEETAATIAGGDYAKLGLTQEQATDYLARWFDSYIERNGEQSVEEFSRAREETKQIIEAAKARAANTSEGQAESASRPADQTIRQGQGVESRGSPGRDTETSSEVARRSLPATLRNKGLQASDELYERYTNKASIADAKALFQKLGFDASEALLTSGQALGAEHMALSEILQRTLLTAASEVSESDPDLAAELRAHQQELASSIAAISTRAGQFNQAAAATASNVEDVMMAAAKVARERGQSLTGKEAARIHNAGESLERATASLEVVAGEVADRRAQVEADKDTLARAEEGALTEKEIERLRKRLTNLRAKEKTREAKIATLDEQIPDRPRKPRAPRVPVKQRAVDLLAANESDLMAQVRSLLGGSPLKMALPEKEIGASRPSSLSDETINTLAQLGALKLLRSDRSKFTVTDFKRETIKEFGGQIRPEINRIHAESVRVMKETLRQARHERAIELIAAREGNEDLNREELDAIAESEREAGKRAALVRAEHEKVAREFGKSEKPTLRAVAKTAGRAEARLAREAFRKAQQLVRRTARKASQAHRRSVEGVDVGSRALASAIGRNASNDIEAISAAKLSLPNMTPVRFMREMKAEHNLDGKTAREAFKSGASVLESARHEINQSRQVAAALKTQAAQSEEELDQALAKLQESRRAQAQARRMVAREFQALKKGRARVVAEEAWRATKGVPISIMASGDISGIFNQGGIAVWMHPTMLPEFATATIKSWSDSEFAHLQDAIERDADFPLMQRMKVDFAFAGGRDQGEEMFQGADVLQRIPGVKQTVGTMVKKSDQSFGGGLDWLRASLAKMIITQLQKEGVTYKDNQNTYERMGAYINIITGRGDIGQHNTKVVKAILGVSKLIGFAPRYRVSRLQFLALPLTPSFYHNVHPAARRIILKDLLSYYGKMGGLMLLLTALGYAGIAATSFDPDDDDFLKMKIGKLRLDLTGGNQTSARLVSRLFLEGYRGLTGQVTGEMAAKQVGKMTVDWLSSGADPRASLVKDWWTGKDFKGSPFHWGGLDGAIATRIMPMSWNAAANTARDEGLKYGAAQLPLDATGIKASVYPDRPDEPKTTAEKLAVRFAQRDYGSRKPLDEETRRTINELKTRARGGEDVSGEVRLLVEDELINERYAESIIKAKDQTFLQEKFRQLSLEDARHVLKYATPEEKASLEEVMRDKELKAAEKEAKQEQKRLNPERTRILKERAKKAQRTKRARRELRYGSAVNSNAQ